jgi:hypothetical protein
MSLICCLTAANDKEDKADKAGETAASNQAASTRFLTVKPCLPRFAGVQYIRYPGDETKKSACLVLEKSSDLVCPSKIYV